MKSAILPAIIFAALSSSLTHVVPTVAQQEEPEVQTEREVDESAAEVDPPEIEDDDAGEGDEPNERPRSRARASSKKLHRQLTKLQKLMKSRLDLSEQQEETIDTLFEHRLQGLKKRQGETKKRRGRAQDREEVREIRDELKEARKAGDKERIRELRQQLGQILQKRRSSGATSIDGFLLLVTNELDQKQVLPFRRLVKHVGLDEYGGGRIGPLRELMRAVMSPNVNLSREQRRAIRDTLRAAIPDTRRSSQDPQEQERLYQKLRGEIMAQLTPEQRVEFEAALEEGGAARRNERRADPVRDRHDKGEPVDTDDEDAGEDETEPDETGAEEAESDDPAPEKTGTDDP